jgi:EAL domain-containing protein (putative c-di-GMP-specific phosphodiesterase class I)
LLVITLFRSLRQGNQATQAEGVKNAEQRAFLQANGCDIYQGYLKSKPIPATDFAQLLQEHR